MIGYGKSRKQLNLGDIGVLVQKLKIHRDNKGVVEVLVIKCQGHISEALEFYCKEVKGT